ncbi:hypothetical protein [Ramlibacter sp. AN1133]|uniref:hypothetical protein n=1 Tax=Ramlibacter sp. AN1133 TaxID=3133429 RepID=UPI0030BEB7B9
MDTAASLASERLVHARALLLLQEVRDYLMRLPVIPATRELARRVDGFLADPQASAVQVRAREEVALARTWDGGYFTPAGEPVLQAEVRPPRQGEMGAGEVSGIRILTLAGEMLTGVGSEVVSVRSVLSSAERVYPGLRLELRPSQAGIFELLAKDPASD